MIGSLYFYILSFTVAFSLVVFATPQLIRFSYQRMLFIDRPDSRRLHKAATPRCGGISVFLAFQATCLLCFLLPQFSNLGTTLAPSWWSNYFLASSFLLIVGLFDDAAGLRWPYKLLGQCAVALYMYSNGVAVDKILAVALPEWLNLAATLLWFSIIINAFNLIDGLDGLAAGLAAIAAVGIAAILFYARKPADVVVLTALTGACVGFLIFNFHPARIFLGDSGSMFLGFTLATFSLSTGTKSTMITALGVPLLAIGIPLFDTVLAIWRRSLRAFNGHLNHYPALESVVRADMEHVHHRLLRGGLNQRKAAILLYVTNLFCVSVGVLILLFNSRAMGIFFLAFVIGAYVTVRHIARTELWDSGALILEGLRRPSSPALAVLLYPPLDFIAFNICLFAAITLTTASPTEIPIKELYFKQIPVWCVIPFVAIAMSGTYNRVWSRARVSEFVFLALALIGGIGVATGISLLEVSSSSLKTVVAHATIFSGLSAFFILGLRAAPRAVRDLMEYANGSRKDQSRCEHRILVYGAGLRCRLFLKKYFSVNDMANSNSRIIGIIDDDPNLRKRIVHGYRILGCGTEIPAIVETEKITKIVMACGPQDPAFLSLRRYCEAHDIALSVWVLEEQYLTTARAGQVQSRIFANS